LGACGVGSNPTMETTNHFFIKAKMKNSLSRSSSVDTEKCVENIGNRFDLVIAASARSREISRRNQSSNQLQHRHPVISALLDVQEGRVGKEYLKKVN
jgi:DNA-directed RNA polymerase omega subunit